MLIEGSITTNMYSQISLIINSLNRTVSNGIVEKKRDFVFLLHCVPELYANPNFCDKLRQYLTKFGEI